ncbi:transmembrane protein 182-like [Amia ocellicauda]|uniref:transmembrane protein 182-like n=1 Tax=Amia ocellicauda TaxID=2972642 RepID=UPI003464C1BA|nr:TM182 protein [Amia calva]
MKAGIAAFVAGVVGTAGLLCFLTAFGTDYWLLASDSCEGNETPQPGNNTGTAGPSNGTKEVTVTKTNSTPSHRTFHHEGFFWRCWFREGSSSHSVWTFLFTNQPPSKLCVHGYLFPLPIAIAPVPHPSYDATAVFRGFWTVFIVLAMAACLAGGFLLVCAVPFISAKLYRLGGAFLISAAVLFLLLVCLFALWKEVAADVPRYILLERSEACHPTTVIAQYGWSFMFAAAGIPLVLLSGLLFYFIGRYIEKKR